MIEISDSQALAAINEGEFPSELRSASAKVAILLSQSWCPQWQRMRGYIQHLPKIESLSIFYLEYDRTPYFNDFLRFKENVLGNREVPYLRLYAEGSLVFQSNYLGEEAFLARVLQS